MSLRWTKCAAFPPPTESEILALTKKPDGSDDPEGLKKLIELWRLREDAIRAAEEDPVYKGIVLKGQRRAEELLSDDGVDELWVLGGHRSSKSYTAGRMVMRALLENPGTEIMCWAQNQEVSIERQQPYIYKMLPKEYRGGPIRDGNALIAYTRGGGFSNNKLILPNGSACYFKFYSQFLNDDSVAEGANLGCADDSGYINVGCWMDEYLCSEELVSRMRSRCSERNAKIILTFTPMHGYTSCVGSVLGGARTVETAKAELLGNKEVPVEMECENPSRRVLFFHTKDNPYANWERLKRNLIGKPDEEILIVAYGYPTRGISAAFVGFSDSIHVYDPDEEDYDFTDRDRWCVYHITDPAGARSWCSGWIAVSDRGEWRAFAEWPDRARHGAWAVEKAGSSSGDEGSKWKEGPAATNLAGMSLSQLKTEWLRVEGGIRVHERIIDGRFAHDPRSTANSGKKTLQDDLREVGIHTVASDGGNEEDGIAAIQQLLALPDPENPFDRFTNCPKLRFSRNCANWIHAMTNYHRRGNSCVALKDFIDIMRYAARHRGGRGLEFYGKNALAVTETWGY